jgi:hypothetical protein
VKFVEILERAIEVELGIIASRTRSSGMVRGAFVKPGVLGSDAFGQETFKLLDLPLSYWNGILHDAPMDLVLAWWNGPSPLVSEVILCFHLNQPLVRPVMNVIIVNKTSSLALFLVSDNIFILQVTIHDEFKVLIVVHVIFNRFTLINVVSLIFPL